MKKHKEMEEKVVLAVKEFANSINSGRSIVFDMSGLINATSCLSLSSLNYWERLIRCEFSLALENNVRSKWNPLTKRARHLTWLDLISWEGYKREKTLRTLSGSAPNSFFFALALRRLNDWVPQVREAARIKLPLIVEESDLKSVVDALSVTLPHWNSWGRMEESDKQVLLDIVSNEKVTEAFIEKFVTATSGPMALILSQIGRTSALDVHLKYIAENAVQPAVRAKALRSLFEGKMTCLEGRKFEWTDIRYCEGRMKPVVTERHLTIDYPFLESLRSASVDPSPMVKRVAADKLICELKTLGEEAWVLANVFFTDKSPSVSERGDFALRKLKEIEKLSETTKVV